MKVAISTTLPAEWKKTKPIHSYDTHFLYTGVERYDMVMKTLSSFTSEGEYTNIPCEDTTFSSSYAKEAVRITIYSQSPRVWSEELSPHDVFFFVQQPTQAV
jgi:hypothetical protein